MSWVFLTAGRAYKFKKPVRADFLDYSTLSARETCCREEVRLNRRLAPSIYLEAIPIRMDEHGGLAIDGPAGGAIVEWLVVMRRLPAERMLDRAIRDGTLCMAELGAVLDYLFDFYVAAEPVDLDVDRKISILRAQLEGNAKVLRDPLCRLPAETVDDVLDALRGVVSARPHWFLEPFETRRIIEGHGDLRPEHVCLATPPAIIDCLEFNRDLRLLDPFEELCFLALECRQLGADDIAAHIVDRYSDRTGIRPSRALLNFYTAHRATIRARLALSHLYDKGPVDTVKWLAKGQAYIEVAHAAVLSLSRPEGR